MMTVQPNIIVFTISYPISYHLLTFNAIGHVRVLLFLFWETARKFGLVKRRTLGSLIKSVQKFKGEILRFLQTLLRPVAIRLSFVGRNPKQSEQIFKKCISIRLGFIPELIRIPIDFFLFLNFFIINNDYFCSPKRTERRFLRCTIGS